MELEDDAVQDVEQHPSKCPKSQSKNIVGEMGTFPPVTAERIINCCVVPFGKEVSPYSIPVLLKGNVTSLKQVFSENPTLSNKVFLPDPNPTYILKGKGKGKGNPRSMSMSDTSNSINSIKFRVFRKCIEGSQKLSGRTLHILLLKSEVKYPRNGNAYPLELYCGAHFYGTLVVALNENDSPYALQSFDPIYMQLLSELNVSEKKSFPPNLREKSPTRHTKDSKPQIDNPQLEYTFQVSEVVENLESCEAAMGEELFFMYRFKTMYCPRISTKHEWSRCIYAHNGHDFRRPPDLYFYLPDDCPRMAKAFRSKSNAKLGGGELGCLEAENCRYCHSKSERLYHPYRYKTCPCETLKSKKKVCQRGKYCAFFHSKQQKRDASRPLVKKQLVAMASADKSSEKVRIFDQPDFKFRFIPEKGEMRMQLELMMMCEENQGSGSTLNSWGTQKSSFSSSRSTSLYSEENVDLQYIYPGNKQGVRENSSTFSNYGAPDMNMGPPPGFGVKHRWTYNTPDQQSPSLYFSDPFQPFFPVASHTPSPDLGQWNNMGNMNNMGNVGNMGNMGSMNKNPQLLYRGVPPPEHIQNWGEEGRRMGRENTQNIQNIQNMQNIHNPPNPQIRPWSVMGIGEHSEVRLFQGQGPRQIYGTEPPQLQKSYLSLPNLATRETMEPIGDRDPPPLPQTLEDYFPPPPQDNNSNNNNKRKNNQLSSYMKAFSNSKGLPYYTQLAFEDTQIEGNKSPLPHNRADSLGHSHSPHSPVKSIGSPTPKRWSEPGFNFMSFGAASLPQRQYKKEPDWKWAE